MDKKVLYLDCHTQSQKWAAAFRRKLWKVHQRQNSPSSALRRFSLPVHLSWALVRNHGLVKNAQESDSYVVSTKDRSWEAQKPFISLKNIISEPPPHNIPSILKYGHLHSKYNFITDKVFWKYFYDFALEVGWPQATGVTYNCPLPEIIWAYLELLS